MVRRRVWVVIAIAVAVVASGAGCDQVFGLTQIAPPTVCPYAVSMPGDDRDNDGIPDDVDPCPLVANHDPHDEDGDGIPDACDPCPHLPIDSADADCDMIGAACDPDDTVPHRQWFYAFHNTSGLALYQSTVADGQLQLPLSGQNYGEAFAVPHVSANGTYEIAGTLSGLDGSYMEMSLIFAQDAGLSAPIPYYEVSIRNNTAPGQYPVFLIEDSDEDLASIRQDELPSTIAFRITATITDTTLDATLDGFTKARLAATITALPQFVYGIDLFRSDTDSPHALRVDYLRRVAPLAP